MADAKMVNIGQLVREYATEKKVMLVGFSTHSGAVIAAREWGENMQKMRVPAASEVSCDSLLHELRGGTTNLLIFKDNTERENKQLEEQLGNRRRGQRVI